LRRALGNEFRVILERDHLHVEHNPPAEAKAFQLSGAAGWAPRAFHRGASLAKRTLR
jgi:hypothetical protein